MMAKCAESSKQIKLANFRLTLSLHSRTKIAEKWTNQQPSGRFIGSKTKIGSWQLRKLAKANQQQRTYFSDTTYNEVRVFSVCSSRCWRYLTVQLCIMLQSPSRSGPYSSEPTVIGIIKEQEILRENGVRCWFSRSFLHGHNYLNTHIT